MQSVFRTLYTTTQIPKNETLQRRAACFAKGDTKHTTRVDGIICIALDGNHCNQELNTPF